MMNHDGKIADFLGNFVGGNGDSDDDAAGGRDKKGSGYGGAINGIVQSVAEDE